MSRNWSQDLIGVLRGAQTVVNATIKLQESQCKQIWENSSFKNLVEEAGGSVNNSIRQSFAQGSVQNDLSKMVMETVERTSMVFEGLKGYARFAGGHELAPAPPRYEEFDIEAFKILNKNQLEDLEANNKDSTLSNENIYQHFSKPVNIPGQSRQQGTVSREEIFSDELHKSKQCAEIKTSNYREVPIESQILEALVPPAKDTYLGTNRPAESIQKSSSSERTSSTMKSQPVTPKIKTRQTLSETAKQRKVPSSRIARLVSFGSLAAGLGIGTVAEVTRRSLGLTQEEPSIGRTLDSAFLSEANAERIVNTLCKVRGAALKLGQILSIQDSTIISPSLQKAFERVRQSADFMPVWQVEKVMESELGNDWRSKVLTFDPKPFAAASIGQVHHATLPDGTEVAMKIQYPGVAKGIESDIDNLVSIMKVWNVFPEALFIDNLVEVAKRELSWEVDYERESECSKKFKELLEPYPDYFVPRVVDNLCTKQVFTTELVDGIPVDKCVDLDIETRERIGRLLMELCLMELFEFQYMQTDPNWSNFFYNPETRKLILLDFGASRSYEKGFLDVYIQIIRGAADDDRDKVLKGSRELGFLTGYESKIMETAHVDAVMILGEVFRKPEPFDFGKQDTTRQIQHLVPTMVKHRLCPPPEEIYSLHRKLSGVFLLLAKLNVKIECKSMFDRVYEKYSKR